MPVTYNKVIHKYALKKGVCQIEISGALQVLSFRILDDEPVVWVLKDTKENAKSVSIIFNVLFTGEKFTCGEYSYVGTDEEPGVGLIYHCFYKFGRL